MGDELKLSSLDELKKQINNRISDFNIRRQVLKRRKNTLVVGQLILTAVATILIAININFDSTIIAIVAIVLNGCGTIFASLLSQFMFNERLASHISTICSLRELQARIKMDMAKDADCADEHKIEISNVEYYFEDLQKILNIANNEWQKLVKSNVSKTVVHENPNV